MLCVLLVLTYVFFALSFKVCHFITFVFYKFYLPYKTL